MSRVAVGFIQLFAPLSSPNSTSAAGSGLPLVMACRTPSFHSFRGHRLLRLPGGVQLKRLLFLAKSHLPFATHAHIISNPSFQLSPLLFLYHSFLFLFHHFVLCPFSTILHLFSNNPFPLFLSLS